MNYLLQQLNAAAKKFADVVRNTTWAGGTCDRLHKKALDDASALCVQQEAVMCVKRGTMVQTKAGKEARRAAKAASAGSPAAAARRRAPVAPEDEEVAVEDDAPMGLTRDERSEIFTPPRGSLFVVTWTDNTIKVTASREVSAEPHIIDDVIAMLTGVRARQIARSRRNFVETGVLMLPVANEGHGVALPGRGPGFLALDAAAEARTAIQAAMTTCVQVAMRHVLAERLGLTDVILVPEAARVEAVLDDIITAGALSFRMCRAWPLMAPCAACFMLAAIPASAMRSTRCGGRPRDKALRQRPKGRDLLGNRHRRAARGSAHVGVRERARQACERRALHRVPHR